MHRSLSLWRKVLGGSGVVANEADVVVAKDALVSSSVMNCSRYRDAKASSA